MLYEIINILEIIVYIVATVLLITKKNDKKILTLSVLMFTLASFGYVLVDIFVGYFSEIIYKIIKTVILYVPLLLMINFEKFNQRKTAGIIGSILSIILFFYNYYHTFSYSIRYVDISGIIFCVVFLALNLMVLYLFASINEKNSMKFNWTKYFVYVLPIALFFIVVDFVNIVFVKDVTYRSIIALTPYLLISIALSCVVFHRIFVEKVCDIKENKFVNINREVNKKVFVEDKLEEIKKFKGLLDDGIITKKEFDEEKKKILNKK